MGHEEFSDIAKNSVTYRQSADDHFKSRRLLRSWGRDEKVNNVVEDLEIVRDVSV